MSAIGVAEALRFIVVFGEEQGGVGTVGGVLVKKAIYRTKEDLGMSEGESALATHVGLQVGHEQGCGNPLPGDVTDYKAEMLLAEIEKVEVISANLAGLEAETSVLERLGWRLNLGKQPCLNLLGNLDFLSGAPFRIPFLPLRAALAFYRERELRRIAEVHAARRPLVVLPGHVLRDKPNASFGSDE